MKRIMKFLALAAIIITAASCSADKLDKEIPQIYQATVTFRPQADGSYFLKVEEDKALVVCNSTFKEYPFKDGKEKRALISFISRGETKPEGVSNPGGLDKFKYVEYITLGAIDTLYTKSPVHSGAYDAANYGSDDIVVFCDHQFFPYTIIEDGYLNLCFTFPTAGKGIVHEINLVTGSNPENPYELVIRHNAHGDLVGSENRVCIVNFPLKDLPDTNGEIVDVTLKWNTEHAEQSTKFKYCTRTDW